MRDTFFCKICAGKCVPHFFLHFYGKHLNCFLGGHDDIVFPDEKGSKGLLIISKRAISDLSGGLYHGSS